MTLKTYLPIIAACAFAACNNNGHQDKSKQETPKALEAKSSSYELVSKSRGDDLVESLYSELISKDKDLKELEDKLTAIRESWPDSIASFNQFKEKNDAYIKAANNHIETIGDSLLRKKMEALITANLNKYNVSIARHQVFLASVDQKNKSIADLHTVLKIVKTLPLIERYQRENRPSTRPIVGFEKEQDKVIQLADTLIKQ
ncbi:hypothetical protein [Paraflavitalea sp. CAU 1676]|uniref:hypothetical protein n=1 Tax=Paraflavitalea sp. CAU 1676 TaxID=3032598 RepID=UPI0023DB87DF|nr:hypothetical protein [Paraflavitalea sp. CAU 1676]MDF2193434.1 hypothetical protein [Paraflavitalea sp. CAU 1676]